MKTIKEWFESFPDPDIRARLLANLERQPHNRDAYVESFQRALGEGFQWRMSIEGRDNPHDGNEFWNTICESIDGDLPATTAEYYADLRDRNAKHRLLHLSMQSLLRKIQDDFGWMADLSGAGARFIDEAQVRRTLQRVENLLRSVEDTLPRHYR